tara:strand:+ start:132 stop:584 length:453 start_codon:yes stop_codon:yes gene_type:complete
MNGPLIKEHVTNGTLAGVSTTYYRVKTDGRDRIRVFVKGTIDATVASGAVDVWLTAVPHFSNLTVNPAGLQPWPTNLPGNDTDFFVYPQHASVPGYSKQTFTSAGDFSGALFTSTDGKSAEYVVVVQNYTKNGAAANLNATAVYLVTELV